MISFTSNHCLVNVVAKRFARKKIVLQSWPNDWVPFLWSRPEQVPGYRSAIDLVPFKQPSNEDIQPEFSCSDELKKLNPNDPVRQIFSCDHARPGKLTDIAITNMLTQFGLIHEVDHANSLEAKIIHLTMKLRKIYSILDTQPQSRRHTRTVANSMKGRRLGYLFDLKKQHSERYERILQLLQIEPDQHLINVEVERPYRKIQMRRMAVEYSRDLKEKKVEEFIASLEKEKADFADYKKQTQNWIAEQEKKLGIVA